MKTKVAVILGSPSGRSSSSELAKAVVGSLSDRNPEVETFVLNDLSAKGCQACFSCKTVSEGCILNDDLTPVLNAALDADLTIVATPIYIGEVTSQLKVFIDRSFSWFKPDYLESSNPSRVGKGKTLILIVTQGDPDREVYSRNIEFYARYFGNHGFSVKTFLAEGLMPGDFAAERPRLLKEAAALAKGV